MWLTCKTNVCVRVCACTGVCVCVLNCYLGGFVQALLLKTKKKVCLCVHVCARSGWNCLPVYGVVCVLYVGWCWCVWRPDRWRVLSWCLPIERAGGWADIEGPTEGGKKKNPFLFLFLFFLCVCVRLCAYVCASVHTEILCAEIVWCLDERKYAKDTKEGEEKNARINNRKWEIEILTDKQSTKFNYYIIILKMLFSSKIICLQGVPSSS